jgi:hypothetical protein
MLRQAVVVALASGLIACGQTRRTYDSPYGKESGKELSDSWDAARRKEAARFTDADLRRMVERLFERRDPDRTNFQGLASSGRRAVPFLIQALNDPRTWTADFDREMSPFHRISYLLEGMAPAEAVAPLVKYLDHPKPEFRRQAAMVLASIGTAECLEPVKRALADSDSEMRNYTLIGLAPIPGRTRNETFLTGVFPAVVPLLKTGEHRVENPAQVLVAINPARAIPLLESPEYFRLDNPQLGQIMKALNRPDVKVPAKVLAPILRELERLATHENSRQWDYAAALLLYARNPDKQAEAQFRLLIQSEDGTIAEAAAHGLEILAGVDGHEAVRDAYDKRGFAAMTKPQQYYFAVEEYKNEVFCDGHEDYFYDSYADIYQVAIEALGAIGAPSRAAVLKGTLDAFAPLRPSVRNEQRQSQMAYIDDLRRHIFAMADEKFSESEEHPGERLAVLLALYALNHKSDFAWPNPQTAAR